MLIALIIIAAFIYWRLYRTNMTVPTWVENPRKLAWSSYYFDTLTHPFRTDEPTQTIVYINSRAGDPLPRS